MMETYDRYYKLRRNGEIGIVPFVKIKKRSTDFFEKYNRVSNRLDLISYKYYNDSGYAWLIMQANPEYSSIEQEIPDGTELRIPYPLDINIAQYDSDVANL